MSKFTILESWHNGCDNAEDEIYATCNNKADAKELLLGLGIMLHRKNSLGEDFPDPTKQQRVHVSWLDTAGGLSAWIGIEGSCAMGSEHRRIFRIVEEEGQDFGTAFSQEELNTMSDIFHEYKDGHRTEKRFILPAMALERKFETLSEGRYQADTTYDTKDFTVEDINRILDDACEDYAKEYNKDEDYFVTNANGFYVNVKERKIEFEFTVMNEKFWKDVPFDTFREEYGIDLNKYTHLFTN